MNSVTLQASYRLKVNRSRDMYSYYCFALSVLEEEPRVFLILGKSSTIELLSSPLCLFFSN